MPQAIRFMSNEAQSFPVQRYGKYHLVRKLASGGMAEIFLAKLVGPEGFEKNVVIKRLHAHLSDATDFVTMFHDEAKIVARLAHPNVVQVLELGTQDGSTFMAMEYLAGEDFSNVVLAAVERGEPTPVEVVLKVIGDAALGLHYAHEFVDADGTRLNIVHRDVSLPNIVVTFSGQVKLIDFGLVKAATRLTQTTAGMVKGTYHYMAPEQASNQPMDARADIYSLGVCLYEALTHTRAFPQDSAAGIIAAIMTGKFSAPREVRPDLPEELERMVLKAMAKDPSDRYATAAEFASDIDAFSRATGAGLSGLGLAQYMRKSFGPDRVAAKEQVGPLSSFVSTPAPSVHVSQDDDADDLSETEAYMSQGPSLGADGTLDGPVKPQVTQKHEAAAPVIALNEAEALDLDRGPDKWAPAPQAEPEAEAVPDRGPQKRLGTESKGLLGLVLVLTILVAMGGLAALVLPIASPDTWERVRAAWAGPERRRPVHVSTFPGNATVRVDGVTMGTTPWAGDVPLDAKSLTLQRVGYEVWEHTFVPGDAETVNLQDVKLLPKGTRDAPKK